MQSQPSKRIRSLKTKFIGLLFLGGLTAGVIGGWITYRATDAQLQQRLLIRIDTLASALNHAAMVTSDWSIVQHMIMEVINDHPDIHDILIADKASLKILAASQQSVIGQQVESLPDRHIRQELSDALAHDHFGYHFEPDRDEAKGRELVIIAPLKPNVELRPQSLGGSKLSDNTENQKNDTFQAQNEKIELLQNRGAILIRVSRYIIDQGSFDIAFRFMIAVLAAIAVILLIAYLVLDHQVLRPIGIIHSIIGRRQSGDTKARIDLRQNDEIAAVAQTLNETLDKDDEQVKALSNLLDQNEELRNRLQAASNSFVEINERYLRKIGADLHDGPAQLIAFALLRLDSLKMMLRKNYAAHKDASEISAVYDALHDAMAEIRELSAGLTLAKLEDMSPIEVLNEIVGAHENRTDTTVDLDIESVPAWLPLPIKIAVFRFVQEALNNAYEHADGVDQIVECRFQDHDLELKVSDGGPGFAPEKVITSNSGLGLVGLRQRIESLGGTFEVASAPNKGASLIMRCHVEVENKISA